VKVEIKRKEGGEIEVARKLLRVGRMQWLCGRRIKLYTGKKC